MGRGLWFSSQTKINICETTTIILPYILYNLSSLKTVSSCVLGRCYVHLTDKEKWGPEKVKDLPQVTQQVGSRTSNRTQIPGSSTLSIILSYLPYDTMKLEKKILHGPNLTNTTSLLSAIPFSPHMLPPLEAQPYRRTLGGCIYTVFNTFSKNTSQYKIQH